MPVTEEARGRLISLFSFFKAVEQRRYPVVRHIREQPWALRLADLPEHERLQVARPVEGDDGARLKLVRPEIHPCPPPPETLNGWLKEGWDDPDREVTPIEVRTEFDDRGEPYESRFAGQFERLRAYDEWIRRRRLWASAEGPARKLLRLYERFFALHSQIEREGEAYDLLLGDGIFDWREIRHPILLHRVELNFEPRRHEFRVVDSEAPTEFYSALFAGDEFAGLPVNEWQRELLEGELHPMGGEGVSDWLKTIVGRFPDGEFVEGEPAENAIHPRLGRAPILFLRKREMGRLHFLDEILADLQEADTVPESLLRIVGCAPPNPPHQEERATAYANEEEDILLSKPANAEQLTILRRLARHSGVLVQGPPGTGKTHTIANLIGSLLSEGKSVLVTSHSTKALRVLRGQVEEQLQPLCVSVLDSDKAGREELKGAVRALAGRLDDDLGRLEREAVEFATRRKKILDDLRTARRDLGTAINGEYQPIVLAGAQYEPVTAAKEVATGAGRHDWIPDPLPLDHLPPLSDAELRVLYGSTARIEPEDEADLAQPLPPIAKLRRPEQFEQATKEFTQLTNSNLGFRKELWNAAANPAGDITATLNKMTLAVNELELSSAEPWRLAVIEAGMGGNVTTDVWAQFCTEIEALQRQARGAAQTLSHHSPIPSGDGGLEIQFRVTEEIISYLERRRRKIKLSSFALWRHPQWKLFIDRARVEVARRPFRLEHFHALREVLRLKLARKNLMVHWQGLMTPLGAPIPQQAVAELEAYTAQFVPKIRACLAWHQSNWVAVRSELVAHGLNWQALVAQAPVLPPPHIQAKRLRHVVQTMLPEIVEAEARRRRYRQIQQVFDESLRMLSGYPGIRAVNALGQAIAARNPDAYRQGYTRIGDLLLRQPIFLDRRKKLEKLRAVSPNWAEALQRRRPPHDQITPPGEIGLAWRWSQFREELDRRAALSVPELQARIERLGEDLRRVTTNLIERRAWAALIRRINMDQGARQALLGWAATMQRIGAGTGRNVRNLLNQAQKLMGEARRAVPVWIMPFSRITENFHPLRDHFDVIVVDEASQEDVLGIAPFYMADKVIVVGDDEQVTPLDVGGKKQPIQDLIEQWLSNFPSTLSPHLFDLKTSIYDRAKIAFGNIIQLKEHFRCVPEIIQFSNHLSYAGDIRPLRESASTPVKPALVAHRVLGERRGDTNILEAETITALIAAAIEQPEYDGKSFGVITLVEDKQADEIERRLRTRLDAVEIENRRILCGKPPHFQGDERDVIFLSMVDSQTEGGGPLGMRADGADGLWKKRYNVAASRAKDQLWVVYSLDHQTQLKPGDLRRRLIEHALDPNALMRLLEEGRTRTESPFEAEVYRLLVAQGYRVHPQWKVGAYRIDLVVEGEDKKRLAIECDGDRYHYDRVAEDMARQALLERMGWRFVRIRGTSFYRDRKTAMEPVFEKLEQLGIGPIGLEAAPAGNTPSDTLLERVKRRASELQQLWAATPDE
jgi:very-short-patch-repair endonuclease/cellulose biosynthesis protein BcsQ